jgi:hypothetical protein
VANFSGLVGLGRRIERYVDADARVGVFNAGLVAVVADRQRITHLDGLVNDHDYLHRYYARDRVGDYLRDEGIALLADGFSLDWWRSGAWQHLAGDAIDVLHMRRVGPDNAAWLLRLPEVTASTPLRIRRDPLASILVRAQAEQDLTIAAGGDAWRPPDERLVVASFVVPPDDRLQHVLMAPAQARSALVLDDDSAVQRLAAAFADGLELVAYELPWWPVLAGDVVELRLYLRVPPGHRGPHQVAVRIGGTGELSLPASAPSSERVEPLFHAPQRAATAPAESYLAAHCTALRAPAEVAAATLPVWVGVRRPGEPWQVTRLGELRVER